MTVQAVSFSIGGRNRAELVTDDIARLYLDPAAARTLYRSNAVVDTLTEGALPAASAGRLLGPFTVDGRADWVPTGVVRPPG